MTKLGVMMIGLNEQVTAGAALYSAMDHADFGVYIDTGSDDKTIEIMEVLCKNYIDAGMIHIEKMDIGPELSMHKARTRAFEILQSKGMDYFLKLDADEICYKESMAWTRQLMNSMDPSVTSVWFPGHELYQYDAEDGVEWCENIMAQRDFYEMTDQAYGKRWLCRMKDCFFEGNWTDESRGKKPEGLRYPRLNDRRAGRVLLAHYGWARPNDEQRAKAVLRYGEQKDWNPRVDRLHREPWCTERRLRVFKNHPTSLMANALTIRNMLCGTR